MRKTDAEEIQRINKMVYRYALLTLKSPEDAEDITQEVLYRYVMSTTMFENDEALKAWLYKVTINLCRNLRTNSWYKKRVVLDDEFWNTVPSKTEEVDESLLEVIHSLPLKYSEVVLLFYYEEYTVPEIAVLLGKKENTIYSLLNRARKLLKKKIGGTYDEQ